MQYHADNENYLTVWSARFGRERPQGSLASPYMPPTVGAGAGPFASIHYGPIPAGHTRAGRIPFSSAPEPQAQLGQNLANGQTMHGQVMNGPHVSRHMREPSQAQHREAQTTTSPSARQNAQNRARSQSLLRDIRITEPQQAPQHGYYHQGQFIADGPGPRKARNTSASENALVSPRQFHDSWTHTNNHHSVDQSRIQGRIQSQTQSLLSRPHRPQRKPSKTRSPAPIFQPRSSVTMRSAPAA